MEATKTVKCPNCGRKHEAEPKTRKILILGDIAATEREVTFPVKCGCGCRL